MNSEIYSITHFESTPLPEGGWIKLAFICLKDGRYCYNFNNLASITAQEISQGLGNGTLKKLPKPIKTDNLKGLWLDPKNQVWLANRKNPHNEDQKLIEL